MTILLTMLASAAIGFCIGVLMESAYDVLFRVDRALDRLAARWRRFNEWRKG